MRKMIKHCGAFIVINELNQEEWRIASHPTIGDLRLLRQRGAVILHRITQRFGNEIRKTWITDTGIPVVVTSDFLKGD